MGHIQAWFLIFWKFKFEFGSPPSLKSVIGKPSVAFLKFQKSKICYRQARFRFFLFFLCFFLFQTPKFGSRQVRFRFVWNIKNKKSVIDTLSFVFFDISKIKNRFSASPVSFFWNFKNHKSVLGKPGFHFLFEISKI